MVKVVSISDLNFKDIIKESVEVIKKGKVLICPTDTVYGLITDATNKDAVDKIFKIKKRNINKPLPIFVKDIEMAKKIAQISKRNENFLRKNWPGKLTAVLKKKKIKDLRIYGINEKTVGLRISDYNLIIELIKKLNKPLTATSANISGKKPSNKIKEVLNQFKKEKFYPDLVISVGDLPKSKPSKIIDLTVNPPRVLRD